MLIFETIHVAGTAILFFLALPGLDALRAVMLTNAIAVLPSAIKFFDTFLSSSDDIPEIQNIIEIAEVKDGKGILALLYKIVNFLGNSIMIFAFLALLLTKSIFYILYTGGQKESSIDYIIGL